MYFSTDRCNLALISIFTIFINCSINVVAQSHQKVPAPAAVAVILDSSFHSTWRNLLNKTNTVPGQHYGLESNFAICPQLLGHLSYTEPHESTLISPQLLPNVDLSNDFSHY